MKKVFGCIEDNWELIDLLIKAVLVIILCLILISKSSPAHAANPADLTSLQRLSATELYMIARDADQANWFYASLPQSKTSDFELFASSNEKTRERSVQAFYTKRVSQRFDVTFDTNIKGKPLDVANTVSLDLPLKYSGLNFVLPLQGEDDIKLGGRVTKGHFTFFAMASLESDRNPRWGITHKGFITTEAAFREDSGKTYLRFSKSFPASSGTIIPGIRLENQKGKTTLGFSLIYIP